MKNKCATIGCKRTANWNSDYCYRCMGWKIQKDFECGVAGCLKKKGYKESKFCFYHYQNK